MALKLYTYWRSTAAYRVRIALNLKGIEVEQTSVHLVKDGGEQHSAEYVAKNPTHLVPSLELEDGTVLAQSLAIIDYLETLQPDPALLPKDPVLRAKVLAAAHVVAMDIHPVNNLRVAAHLGATFGATPEDKQAWMCHWMTVGFEALEQMVRQDTKFAFGDTPSLADICLVAQYYNARRWGLDLTPYPRLTEIEQTCLAVPAFANAAPEVQFDAQ
ncbi:maleylacetoacetate isomerase [Aliiroseovarius lamellibrachiae]|uniref:maleylacetoacetate isomerase n=1 Tax=Aliiroseovarius lamellibrachiae TaxID=1924933 RepID=UPI001BDF8F3A|nr:maleylacetoacetate isomerase [Aliiroseovarius lamellibrachiae]MBT2132288.1 maleylacetoacetate isomerase [Aliiroseovarius lamellibrachiae]